MFELEKSSLFFEKMAAEHPTLVQNIDIVHENCLQLDASYHKPKLFILSLNNLLRSLLFFVEFSIKNSPGWLADAVNAQKTERTRDHEILKHLRNVSAHQKLVIPDESLVCGLFRIKSYNAYTLKLGFGDHNKPGKYSWDLTLRNTEDLFHDMLVFSSLTFMDLEHSALSECLGITRRWYFKVHFKNNSERFDEVVDVYKLTSGYASELLDRICNAYSKQKNIVFQQPFIKKLEDHNCVNTLLEIDLYPSLFSEWWEGEIAPLNYGVRVAHHEGRKDQANEEFQVWAHKNLCKEPARYKLMLEEIQTLSASEVLKDDIGANFISFIHFNHWHYKSAFGFGFDGKHVAPSEIMLLQRIGGSFFEEYRKGKECTIQAAKAQLDSQCKKLLSEIAKIES